MNVRRKKETEATPRDFIGFMKEESELGNDPLFSKSAIDQYQEKKSTNNEHSKKKVYLKLSPRSMKKMTNREKELV